MRCCQEAVTSSPGKQSIGCATARERRPIKRHCGRAGSTCSPLAFRLRCSPLPAARPACRVCHLGTALARAGASFEHVVRTRVYLADRSDLDEVGRAHAEVFSKIRPVNTTVVTGMVDPAWKLEIDVDALVL
jgi:Endoribonuclease L-PSP